MSIGISVRTRIVDKVAHIDLNVSHPMENGTRSDAAGSVIPSWYLTDMQVFHNDKSIALLSLSPLVSRNPSISISLTDAKEDDSLKITWIDNRGKTGEKFATL